MEKLKVLNRNYLKIIAIVAMLMDHVASTFFQKGSVIWTIFRTVGRITFPVMIFFLVEGFIHTRNLKKYILRMFLFSIISLFSYSFYETGSFLPIQIVSGVVNNYPYATIYLASKDITICICMFSVITNFLLCLLTLTVWEKTKWKTLYKVLLTLLMFVLALNSSWGYMPMALTLSFYYFRNNKCLKWAAYFVFSILYIFNFMMYSNLLAFNTYLDFKFYFYRIGMIIPFLLIEFFYNGKPGKNTKVGRWFFYIFYPAHQVILGILALLI